MEKLEAAKLATQLTVALLEDRSGQFAKVSRAAGHTPGYEQPEVVAVFDYLLDPVQSRLLAQ